MMVVVRDRRIWLLLGVLAVGVLASAVVLTSLRTGQDTNADRISGNDGAISRLQSEAAQAKRLAEGAQRDAETARQEAQAQRRLTSALQEQVRRLGGQPLLTPPTVPARRSDVRSTPAAGDGGRRSAAPSPRASASRSPRPARSPVSPSPSPSPSAARCVLTICLPGGLG